MELIKFSAEEQAKIDADKKSPFVVVVFAIPIGATCIEQTGAGQFIARGLEELKARADRAKMIILDRNISTNVAYSENGGVTLVLTIIGQWAEIEKIEEMQRRQAIAGAPMPRGRA